MHLSELITGDLIDSSAVDAGYLTPLKQFSCPVYLCLGNHERYVDLQNAIDAIEANNVRILRSEAQCRYRSHVMRPHTRRTNVAIRSAGKTAVPVY